MSIRLGQISSDIMALDTNYAGVVSFTPIRISVKENYNPSVSSNLNGKTLVRKDNATLSVDLEFDALSATTVGQLRDVLQNRVYEKKVYIDEPSTSCLYSTDALTLLDCGYSKSDTVPGTLTAFSEAEIATMRYVDSTYYSLTNSTTKYSYLVFNFDLSSFIDAYGVSAVKWITLFMHNPYATLNGQNTLPAGYRVLVYSNKNAKWFQLGEQSYSISDVNLRAVSKMNQQFFTIRKVSQFMSIADCIEDSRYIKFAVCNKNSTVGSTVGLNSVGCIVNGFGCKQINVDNFGYRNSYDASGLTGTVSLGGI